MIEIYKKTIKDKNLIKRRDFSRGSWIYVEDPTAEEINKLHKICHLDKTLLKDAIDPFEVPRLEVENSIVYVFTSVAYKDNERVTTAPLLVAIGEDFICTVSQKPLPFFIKFKEGKLDFSTTQKTKLFIQIFLQINILFNQYLTEINRQLRRVIISPEKIKEKDILQFVSFEETLNTFLSDLNPTIYILRNLLAKKYLKLYKEDEDLVEDILVSTEQIIETCDSNLKSIVNIREAYSTIVTNNLNRVIKILTVLTIILTIPTIIASIYGMNVRLPLESDPFVFWKILGGTFALSLIILLIFMKKDWL